MKFIENEQDSDQKIYEKLCIPPIPSPHKKPPVPINLKELSLPLAKQVKEMESEIIKPIVLKCERCGGQIIIPLPKKKVFKSKKKHIHVTYLHKTPHSGHQHCILFEIDHAFNIQLFRVADVILAKQEQKIGQELYNNFKIRRKLLHCDFCNAIIHIPVPVSIIERAPLSKTPVVYIHNHPDGNQKHAIIVFLDKYFSDRDQKQSDLLLLSKD